jgi:hypothetical protein
MNTVGMLQPQKTPRRKTVPSGFSLPFPDRLPHTAARVLAPSALQNPAGFSAVKYSYKFIRFLLTKNQKCPYH